MAKPFVEGRFEIKEGDQIYNGPHSEISEVELSAGNHSIGLLRKKFRGYPIEFMQGPKWHSFLREEGYPVLPTWRYDEKNMVEYVTDLRRGGTHRVIDFCGGQENSEKVYISNMAELEREVEGLLRKSVDDGLVINEPNIFFDVEISTGIAKVVLGDLRELGYDDSLDNPPTREEILQNNMWVIKKHMERLKDVVTKKSS